MADFLNDILQSEAFRNLLLLIITSVATVVGNKVRQTQDVAKDKLRAEAEAFEATHGVEQTKLLKEIAMLGVRYAQQRYKDRGGPEKLQEAIFVARSAAERYNITLGGMELEQYVEEAYNIVKEEFHKQEEEEEEEYGNDNVCLESDDKENASEMKMTKDEIEYVLSDKSKDAKGNKEGL